MTAKEMFEKAGRRGKDGAAERVKLRDRANTLLSNDAFVDWIGDLMVKASYFGEGRELTPYQQGVRGGIVRAVEELAEIADDGDRFLAKVFREKIKAYVK